MVIIDAANYMYYHAGQDHLNLGESNDVLLCKYFGFSFPQVTWPNLGGALSSHQKVTSFCQESHQHDQWPKLWSIEKANSQPRISTNSNENQSNRKIRINDIKCEIYLLTFSSDKWPLKWAQLFSVAGPSCVKYRPIPLHTNVSA